MSTTPFRPTFRFDQFIAMLAGGLVVILTMVGMHAVSETRHHEGVTITIPEDYDVPFDAKPGDTLNITMYPEGNVQERCDHMGGVLVVNVARNLATCEQADF